MILKIALMSYSFIPSKCFLPGGQLNFQSGHKNILCKKAEKIEFISIEGYNTPVSINDF